jgi:hypothetical protein
MTQGTGSLETLERECAEGRTAPRVSLSDIANNITATFYFTGEEASRAFNPHQSLVGDLLDESLAILTICIIVLENGFTIIGKSAPAGADNFDADLGRKLAYDDAVKQVWPLMGYALRQKLHEERG